MASDPERIEAGWWSQSQRRDYFIAEVLDHTHYPALFGKHRPLGR
jgi:protein ImuB